MMNNAEKLSYSMFQMGDRVLVGLSGGADSVALLCLLNSIKDALSLKIYACHINHGIRGKEAKRDEDFCISLCEKLGVEIFVERISVPEIASLKKCSLETAGRDERYRILNQIAREKGAKIAVAHNLNDLSETVVFNLLRGSSLKGVSSLREVRDNIYRPLLKTSREEIEGYLKKIGQNYVNDSSNFQDEYTRNKIRHNILPLLKEINPKAIEHIASFSERVKEDNDYLENIATSVFSKLYSEEGLSDKINDYHLSIKNRVIALFLEENGVSVSNQNIDAINELILSGGRVNLSGNSMFKKIGNIIYRECPENSIEKTKIDLGKYCFGNIKIEVSFVDLEAKKEYNNKMGVFCLDADKISGEMYIRSREEGDCIKPLKRPTKTLKKLFNEEKIPSEKRKSVPVLIDEKGIMAVLPFAVDERMLPNDKTKRLLIIKTDTKAEE
jgi:tRNA(Ile)-lysidine synthase